MSDNDIAILLMFGTAAGYVFGLIVGADDARLRLLQEYKAGWLNEYDRAESEPLKETSVPKEGLDHEARFVNLPDSRNVCVR